MHPVDSTPLDCFVSFSAGQWDDAHPIAHASIVCREPGWNQPVLRYLALLALLALSGCASYSQPLQDSFPPSVFLNGQILFRGRSAQNFRDPAFLGIVSPDNDAVYLPLKKGMNELVLAVSELAGGWDFICRLTDPD